MITDLAGPSWEITSLCDVEWNPAVHQKEVPGVYVQYSFRHVSRPPENLLAFDSLVLQFSYVQAFWCVLEWSGSHERSQITRWECCYESNGSSSRGLVQCLDDEWTHAMQCLVSDRPTASVCCNRLCSTPQCASALVNQIKSRLWTRFELRWQ